MTVKEIVLLGKLPCFLRNCDVIIRGNTLLNTVAPAIMLTWLHKGRAKIFISNTKNKTVTISRTKPIATLDLELSKQMLTHVTHIERTETDTIMYANMTYIRKYYMMLMIQY